MAFSFESTKTLNSCCCGCSLRTGAIIIAVLAIIHAVFSLLEEFMPKKAKPGKMKVQEQDPAEHIGYIIGYIVSLVVAIILLIGILKRSRKLMLPWLIVSVISVVIALIYVAFVVILLFIKVDPLMALAGLIGGLIGVAIFVYLWLVVHSYYIHLKEEEPGVRSPA
ncbi:hypothetical protein M8J77_020428 [Diaphorina citri]|nr:hypothetical protein M8J77_020428 [Diaphorina citri]